jgi:hypothetical protein
MAEDGRMRRWIFTLAAVLGLAVVAGSGPAALQGQISAVLQAQISAVVQAQEKGGDDYTGPYNVVAGWPKPSRLAKPGQNLGDLGGDAEPRDYAVPR